MNRRFRIGLPKMHGEQSFNDASQNYGNLKKKIYCRRLIMFPGPGKQTGKLWSFVIVQVLDNKQSPNIVNSQANFVFPHKNFFSKEQL